jgi:hypothetical protein
MSDLKIIEKAHLEKLLGMNTGYVLDFSDRTMQEFILEYTRIDIYEDKYKKGSGSKANRLRAFWEKEDNYLVGKLLKELFEKWKGYKIKTHSKVSADEVLLLEHCVEIAERLKNGGPIQYIDAIQANNDDKDFTTLAELLKGMVSRGEFSATLDRLHTFMIKYTKQLCINRGLEVGVGEPLHSLFGKYVNFLKENELIQSKMSIEILRSNYRILEKFNDVRNNQSYAHDNQILSEQESILVLNNVAALIRYLNFLEQAQNVRVPAVDAAIDEYELPF